MNIAFARGLRTILSAWLEILIAGAILYFSTKLFLLYWFVYSIWRVFSEIDYVRAGIRVTQAANEARMFAIIRKLGIQADELREIGEEIDQSMSPETRRRFQEDLTLSMS